MSPMLPQPRGPLGEQLDRLLRSPVDDTATLPRDVDPGVAPDDQALCLWVLHELHYRGFDEVDDGWEWSPSLAPLRRQLEAELESRLRGRFEVSGTAPEDGSDVGDALLELAATHDGPSLARHVQRSATHDEVVELLCQRSIYHLKEADPTTWVLPRLDAVPKAALMQVQYDEYGVGDHEQLHHALFARGLADAGIDATYGAHVDTASLDVLEQNNALSMFGLQRRLRGAALGHLAAVEASSSAPARRLAQGLRRLGFPDSLAAYYDEHVEADAVHEQVVARDVCGALVAENPELRDDVFFGAWTCLDLESRTGSALLERWTAVAA